MSRTLINWIRPLVFPGVILGALEIYARTVAVNSDALAPPSMAVLAFFHALADGSILSMTGFTLACAGLGLLIAAVLGVTLGIMLGLSKRAAQASFLSVEILRTVPSVALIPLAMLIFGFGINMEVSVVAFATVWPILLLTQAATRQIEPSLLEVSRALGLSPFARTMKIIVPAMIPRLFVALRLAVAIALVVAVTVEIVANPYGMGYAIMISQQSMEPALMLAWLFWIGVVGYAVNEGTLRLQQAVARRMGATP